LWLLFHNFDICFKLNKRSYNSCCYFGRDLWVAGRDFYLLLNLNGFRPNRFLPGYLVCGLLLLLFSL